MRLWSRGAAINLGCAAAFAGWCWLWLWLLFEATVRYPGIFTLTGDRGAYEIPERVLGRPAWILFGGFYLLALLPPLLLGMARGWLDADGEGTRALRWAFGSRSLNATAVAAFLLMLAAFVLSSWRGHDELFALALMVVFLLACVAMPFFAWNRATLARPTPDGWRRAAWPGWRTVGLTYLLLAVWTILGFGVDIAAVADDSHMLLPPLWIIDWLADVIVWLAIAVIWLARARSETIRSDLPRALRWPVLGPSLWQNLWLLAAIGGWSWPLLVASGLSIYAVPQFAEIAASKGEELSTGLKATVAIARNTAPLIQVLAPMLVFYALLAQGKLLTRRGIGA